MRIRVNGEWTQQPDGLDVAGLLRQMSLEPLRVAVERNKRLVRRADHAATKLGDGDELEIVTLVGGG